MNQNLQYFIWEKRVIWLLTDRNVGKLTAITKTKILEFFASQEQYVAPITEKFGSR